MIYFLWLSAFKFNFLCSFQLEVPLKFILLLGRINRERELMGFPESGDWSKTLVHLL